ncbi:MAG: 16S rRNA (adenine(1518)-N(6)/adenine(1519)-N(6))-dimethyltransferase RsmA [Oscillospiraceae bacterium]|nr:16S rRNA (adenine(1518)-N(6)/adenine(1519)-N(6))-dimethyltransferase RsmA [Oscillospiraceae bacterium]
MAELSNISTIKELLLKNGVSLSKSLGQNFLINPSVCPRMAEQCGSEATNDASGVLEIGPGIGVLTKELAKSFKKVVAIELDSRLPKILAQTLAEFSNFKLIQGDVLKLDLKRILAEEFADCSRVFICANLPYYITSPIIMAVLEQRLPVEALTVMVQKEAAERICARVGTRACGAVTLAVHYYAEPKLLFNVSRGSFMPAPNVDSAVIRLDIRKAPPFELKDEKMFFSLIKAGFGQRRKTLLNSLSAGTGMAKQELEKAFAACDIKGSSRAEELSLEQFASLANFLYMGD